MSEDLILCDTGSFEYQSGGDNLFFRDEFKLLCGNNEPNGSTSLSFMVVQALVLLLHLYCGSVTVDALFLKSILGH